jgi:CRISPR system Cascade subunit CasD
MPRHLLIRLSSPLIAFGGETIDNFGVIRDFPALSMVTGLIANALGWDRGDDALHNQLQERLRLGTRLESPSSRLTDFQTAQLGAADKAWTTWGAV